MVQHQALSDMVAIAGRHATQLRTPTVIPRMAIWCGERPTAPAPAMYEPKFYIVLQGHKRMTIGSRTLEFGAGRYAVSSVGLPFTGQVIEASLERPYLGLEFALDPAIIASLLFNMPDGEDIDASAIAIERATQDIIEPLDRLLRLLDKPADVRCSPHSLSANSITGYCKARPAEPSAKSLSRTRGSTRSRPRWSGFAAMRISRCA